MPSLVSKFNPFTQFSYQPYNFFTLKTIYQGGLPQLLEQAIKQNCGITARHVLCA